MSKVCGRYSFRVININNVPVDADTADTSLHEQVKSAFKVFYDEPSLHAALQALVARLKVLLKDTQATDYRMIRLGHGCWRVEVYGAALSFDFIKHFEGCVTEYETVLQFGSNNHRKVYISAVSVDEAQHQAESWAMCYVAAEALAETWHTWDGAKRKQYVKCTLSDKDKGVHLSLTEC